MDIYVNGPGAPDCVGAIFAEDYKTGPVRRAPEVLLQIMRDWPAHPNDVLDVALEPPPRCPIAGFGLRFHRCQIIGGGRFLGHALRMDDTSLSTLAAYETAWENHRAIHAH